MREHNFRTRITTGTFTLPTAAILTVVLWVVAGMGSVETLEGLAVVGVMTYLMVELNNRNALLRVRSRMVGTMFLALSAGCPLFYAWSTDYIPALSLLVAYFPLFMSYQKPQDAADIFHAALALGVGSLFYPPLLLLGVAFLVGVAVQLRALSGKTFMALLFGLTLPYYFVAAWGVWENKLATVFLPYIEAFDFAAPDYAAVPLPLLLSGGFVVVLSFIAVVHLFRTAFNDKIRTRMFFYIIVIAEVVLALSLLLQPQKAGILLRLLFVNSAPLIAHHLTLGRGRGLNIYFLVCLLLLSALIVFNLFVSGSYGSLS